MAVAESPGGATNGTVELYEIGGALGCTDSAKKQKTKKKTADPAPDWPREREREKGGGGCAHLAGGDGGRCRW